MSGITPILDTLLHQVLGKPVDLAGARDLNQPVTPLLPGTAPQAVHSDSRLDPRAPTVTANPGTGSRGTAATGSLLTDSSAGSSSTLTHFSQAARTIADVLARFPAPPSVLRAAAPLLQPGEAPQATELAARLKSSVDSSGLFYESHLQRWYKGVLPRAQLELEPQMNRPAGTAAPGQAAASVNTAGASAPVVASPLVTAGAAPAAAADSAGRSGPLTAVAAGLAAVGEAGTPIRPPMANPTYSMPQVSANTALSQPAAGMSPAVAAVPPPLAPPVAAPGLEPAHRDGLSAQLKEAPAAAGQEGVKVRSEPAAMAVPETLQSVVRQQLEMLAIPVLRWEGDVWSGLFMALMIHLPADQSGGQSAAQEQAEPSDEDAPWRTELVLEVMNLGEIRVSLQLSEQRLAMTLVSPSPELNAQLAARREQLEERLSGLGFEVVVLNVAAEGGSA